MRRIKEKNTSIDLSKMVYRFPNKKVVVKLNSERQPMNSFNSIKLSIHQRAYEKLENFSKIVNLSTQKSIHE
jgi:hypothetical protein